MKENNILMSKEAIKIDPETDFSLSGLCTYMNKEYSKKTFTTKSNTDETKFTIQDIQGYQQRKMLPLKYGGHKIEVIRSQGQSLVILRIIGLKKKNKDPLEGDRRGKKSK